MSAAKAAAVEEVQPGEKGRARQRKDKELKRFLSAKRPPAEDIERVTGYRTEACVGWHKANDKGAPAHILEQLEVEHDWACEVMRAAGRRLPGEAAP